MLNQRTPQKQVYAFAPYKSPVRTHVSKQNASLEVRKQQHDTAPHQSTVPSHQNSPASVFAELPPQEHDALAECYADMLNQESDVFYLFDAFHQVLGSLKQVQQQYGIKVDANPFKTNASTSRSDMLSSLGSQWTGMRNLKSLQDSWAPLTGSRL